MLRSTDLTSRSKRWALLLTASCHSIGKRHAPIIVVMDDNRFGTENLDGLGPIVVAVLGEDRNVPLQDDTPCLRQSRAGFRFGLHRSDSDGRHFDLDQCQA